MPDQPIVSVQQFCKSYQNEIAVNNLSFHVDSGQIMGLIGPNGAGKTTTLRAIAGIIPSSGGCLCVCDHDSSIGRGQYDFQDRTVRKRVQTLAAFLKDLLILALMLEKLTLDGIP